MQGSEQKWKNLHRTTKVNPPTISSDPCFTRGRIGYVGYDRPRLQLHWHGPLPADHTNAIYGAISRILPAVQGENGFGLHPIRRRQASGRRMLLNPGSRLTIHMPIQSISIIGFETLSYVPEKVPLSRFSD